jgi:hypothetical protein
LGQELFDKTTSLVLGGFLIPLYTPIQINALGSFIVLLGIYGLCFATAAKAEGGFFSGIRRLANGPPYGRIPNWLVAMPLVSSALLLLVLAITFGEAALGIPTGGVNLAPLQLLYTLAYDAPLEELVFRITTLGLLVALGVMWASFSIPPGNNKSLGRLLLLSFLFPDKAKTAVGMPSFATNRWGGIRWIEWTVLLVTSAGFGIAHLLSPLGWEAGKVATAAIAGFALGLVYLVYGAYASILLHWFFDLYMGVFDVGYMVGNEGYGIIGGLLALFTVFVGIIGIAVIVRWFMSRNKPREYYPNLVPSSPPSFQ